jgi:glucose-1-phosphate thymidylyltransferase
MKGIILAGGTGSRLYPITKVTNKCLLPVGKEPMIFRMLDIFKRSNIEDVMLVTGPEHMGDVISLLGSGAEHSCSITYRVQDEANGIAAALKMCSSFAKGEKFAVILGDNIFSDNDEIAKQIKLFDMILEDYRLFAKSVKDPQRFGVPVLSPEGKVIDIIEKPVIPPCDKAIVGLYCYTDEVFDVIDTLQPSQRGEYEISELNSWLVRNRHGSLVDINCEWIDAGTHDSYKKANEIIWGCQ